jgi:hypothetical protein
MSFEENEFLLIFFFFTKFKLESLNMDVEVTLNEILENLRDKTNALRQVKDRDQIRYRQLRNQVLLLLQIIEGLLAERQDQAERQGVPEIDRIEREVRDRHGERDIHFHFHFPRDARGERPEGRVRVKRERRARKEKVIYEGPRKGLFYCGEGGAKRYLNKSQKQRCKDGTLRYVKSGCYPPEKKYRNKRHC